MSNLNISSRYASALMQLASEIDTFQQVSADMELVYNTIRDSRELQVVLLSPVIKSEDKSRVLTGIFETRVSTDSLSFLHFVIKKNREHLLFNIIRQFLVLRDQKLGVVNAEVYSVVDLTDDLKEKLSKRLEEYTKKKVRLSFSLKNELLGGFVVKINDTVIDASLSHQLELLKEQFLKEGSSPN
ncbi:MAG: ATP synthase F1 subunit delta [Ignavibacteriales bacterium]